MSHHFAFAAPVRNVQASLEALKRHGVDIEGNDQAGTFQYMIAAVGMLAGTYAVDGRMVTVTITTKPFGLLNGVIQSRITGFLQEDHEPKEN